MAKKWTKADIDKLVEENGGDTLCLLGVFPFSENALEEINSAYHNETTFTDSDFCDLIINIAYKSI